VQQRSVFFFLQLSSNQIANRQANLPQLQLHQIVIAPAAPVNSIKTSKRTKRNSNTLPYAQPRRARQLDKALRVFPRAQCGHGGVWHRGKLLITLAQQLAHAVNAAQRRPLLDSGLL